MVFFQEKMIPQDCRTRFLSEFCRKQSFDKNIKKNKQDVIKYRYNAID